MRSTEPRPTAAATRRRRRARRSPGRRSPQAPLREKGATPRTAYWASRAPGHAWLTTHGDESLLEPLDELDLAGGELGDDDPEMLATRGGARLARLGRLDVSDNALSRDGVERLRRVCPNLVADGQRNDDEASLSEQDL